MEKTDNTKEHKLTIWHRLDGLNEYTQANRTNPHVGAAMKRKNEALIVPHIWKCLGGKHFRKIDLDITWYEMSQRRDPDNVFFAIKFILDALVTCNVIDDDSQKHIGEVRERVKVDKKCPRIEVVIKEVES